MTNCNEEPKIMPDWKKVFVSREEFLKLLGLALGGLIGLAITVPGVAFALEYLFVPKGDKWIKVGPVEKFKQGETVDVIFEDPYSLPWEGVSGRRSAWLRRITDDSFLAFAINCTHLGCPVRWEAGAELFLCPCHGGVFYSNGDVAAGPPPRPMHQYDTRIADGQVEIKVGPVLTEG
ncbi:MAG: ubiquinol-cytochrome c reductase iron-sulfur subunit [Terriglobales bacterium]